MVNLMVDSTTEMLNSWERKTIKEGETAEVRIDELLMHFEHEVSM